MGQGKSKNKKPTTTTTTNSGNTTKPTTTTNQGHVLNPTQQTNTDSNSSNTPTTRTDSKNTTNATKNNQNTTSTKGTKNDATSSGFSQKKLEKLFEKYKESTDDVIGPNGIESLCADLAVQPEDVVTLVLAWRLNAADMGYFTKEEFMTGLEKMNVDSVEKLIAQLPMMRKELADATKFKEIYRYSFQFSKSDKEQKSLDLDTADGILGLLLGGYEHEDVSIKPYPHIAAFRTFLKDQTQYKVINMDQWMSILEFSKSVKEDLSDYDENAAWPVLLDMFVEWKREKNE
jgi:DCN1-like protein 4/5